MSVQYGRWNLEGQALEIDELEQLSAMLAPFGPDSKETYSKDGVSIVYRAFHTTSESHRETQPNVSPSGVVITWDGRLDNRGELIIELGYPLRISSTDLDIVSAAYEKWDTGCFAKLIGDWALSIWNPISSSLILAMDPIGSRHLYYSIDPNQVVWSTILDPLVQGASRTFKISEEYIAGWFGCCPAPDLTPYVGIHAVPPSAFVLFRHGKHHKITYWDFDPSKRIRYRTDAEYEEHFRTVFATSIRRRLRSDRPILAELSGGMDSSSIVCVADDLIACGNAEIPRLDTISYYDASHPALNERPYFSKVEERRGRVGYHLDLGLNNQTEENSKNRFSFRFRNGRLAATPDSNRSSFPELYVRYAPYMKSQGYRVTLSGILGESITGGYVPTPIPELQNLLSRGRLFRLAHQLNAWALKMGKTRMRLLWETLRGFVGYSIAYPWAPKVLCPPPWFQLNFVKQNEAALSWYPSKMRILGGLPSYQYQIHLFDHARRCLAYRSLWAELPREIRYPYLDRDLLEFSAAIPPEQMVGVGKRRFLMKRALAGIVPDELLNRKRKEAMRTWKHIPKQWPDASEFGNHILSGCLGIVHSDLFLSALQRACRGEEVPFESLRQTVFIECWLRHLATEGVLSFATEPQERPEHSCIRRKAVPGQLISPKNSAS